jgi:negative regulator of sigma E activity
MMMRRGSLAAFLIASSVAVAGAHSSPSAPNVLLSAAMAAPSTVSYTGVVEAIRFGSSQTQAAVYRVEHRAPNLTLRVYDAPSALSGDCVVAKGDLFFSVDVRRHRIVETQNDAIDDLSALRADNALLRANYRLNRSGSENFDGRPVLDLSLLNKYTGRATMRMRIDETTKIVLDQEEFSSDGAPVSELRFEEIRYAAPVSARDFALPKGYALVRGPTFGESSESPARVTGSAGFSVREPRSLPDGFAPVETSLVEMSGVRTLHLLYSDGLRTVSLFENATASTLATPGLHPRSLRVAGYDAEYVEDGPTALLAWNDGTLYYTLVGELGLVDLQRIATVIGRP